VDCLIATRANSMTNRDKPRFRAGFGNFIAPNVVSWERPLSPHCGP
jgi:hypothetical protein